MRPGRTTGGPRRRGPRLAGWCAGALAVAAVCVLAVTPGAHRAARLAIRLVDAARTLPRHAPKAHAAARDGRPFDGIPAVGALFTVTGGRPGHHFCTASVVDSPVRDLLITAAHCVSHLPPSGIAFVPAYHSGRAPFGVWQVTSVIVSRAWQASADPGDDVAFLVVHRAGDPFPIQDVTGGDSLGTGWPARERVRVIGYPQSGSRPVTCAGRTHPFGGTQMRFDCGGYTDGTSGGPFVTHISRATGDGTVIGVIGGYEQGGATAAVSYSARFAGTVRALYQRAVAAGASAAPTPPAG